MKKELVIVVPYNEINKIEYALDFIVHSKIVDSMFIEVSHIDTFLSSLKITIECEREIVIDRIFGSLEEEYLHFHNYV